MKVVQKYDEKVPGKSYGSISRGTVFSYSNTPHIFMKVSGASVRLSDDSYWIDSAMPIILLDYKEYPNARVVLE